MMTTAKKLLVILAFSLGVSSSAYAVKVGETLPAEVFAKVAGKPLAEVLGNKPVTIINFWATWCAACKVELVEMAELFRKEQGLNYLFISLDSEAKTATSWLKDNLQDDGFVAGNLLVDADHATAEALELQAMPVTLLVDQKGIVREIHNGFKPGQGQTEAVLSNALKLKDKISSDPVTH